LVQLVDQEERLQEERLQLEREVETSSSAATGASSSQTQLQLDRAQPALSAPSVIDQLDRLQLDRL
jgi:hypothetical protein